MHELGELFGWIAAVCYFFAVANYFVKRIYRDRVVRLPKDSAFRIRYQEFMRLLVRTHKYFGMTAGAFALLHLCWQLVNVRVSYSGVLAAALMAVTAGIGMAVAYGHRPKLLKAHRPVAMTVLAVAIFHIVTKL